MNNSLRSQFRSRHFGHWKYVLHAILSFLWILTAQATDWPPGCTEGSLPGNDARYPQDQLILTCLPPNWNGVLVVYAHGYVSPYEPLALPDLGSGDENLATILMSQGFGFATTSYHKNGYAVEQAGDDINNLVAYFNTSFAPFPALKVLAVGGSEGGLITTMLIEKYPATYAGGVALCGPLGGANLEIRYLGDFRAVFDVYFPWIFSFGVVDDIPDDIYIYEDYFKAKIALAFQAHPRRVEQLFNVTNVPRNPFDPLSDLNATLSLLAYSVGGFNDINAVAGGNPYGNLFTWYSGSNNDWPLNRRIERVTPSLAGKLYMLKYYQPTGKLTRPLITAHTTGDEIVPFWHQILYSIYVGANNAQDKLTSIPVLRYGHCNFSTEEVLAAFSILLTKLQLPLSSSLAAYQSALPVN